MTAVITALTGYSIETIKPYVESLNSTGYKGKKYVLYYNSDKTVKTYLEENGWTVKTPDKLNYYINFQRFEDACYLITEENLEKHSIIFTDIKDVYFKKSPEEINGELYIGADIFNTFENHKWNADSILEGFKDDYDEIKNNYPLCAGVIIGKGNMLNNFFYDCFSAGKNSDYNDLVNWCAVDQAAVNVLAYTKYKSILRIPNPKDRIVLNMANLKNLDSIEDYYIYHQYDRHENVIDSLVD